MLRYFFCTVIFFYLILINITYADARFIDRLEVQNFIQHMVNQYHFNKQDLFILFNQVKLRPQVIQHISKPLEKEPWHTYQKLFVNEWRIEHGVQFWNKYRNALTKAEQIYGVPASIIVATIGIETKYGRHTGNYRVIDSLCNLAFSHSSLRASFFKKELEEFLLLTREEKLNPLTIMGSYAGAIGQPQFMPSSYRNYAVNFSNSGKTDLINNEVDVIGSIANYYKKHGWSQYKPIALPGIVIGNKYDYLKHNNKFNSPILITDLSKYGIAPKYKITNNTLTVKIIELENHDNKEYWLGFHNFDVIKRYNSSDLYAMAVFQLSTYITALKEQLNHG